MRQLFGVELPVAAVEVTHVNGLDGVGIETPDTVEGLSFRPIIDNADTVTRETLYFAYTDKIRSVKDRRYKLTEFVHQGCKTALLFDLENDPWETANLVATDGYAEPEARLRKELHRFRDEWSDEEHPLGAAYWDGYRQLT